MAKNETSSEKAPEQKAAGSGGRKQLILAGLLLVGMVVGSASAAIVAASYMMKSSETDASNTAAGDDAEAAKDGSGKDRVATSNKSREGSPEEEQEKTNDPAKLQFSFDEPQLVNVYRTQHRRYLSCKPVFYMSNRDAKEEIEKRAVALQNLMIPILKSKTLDQLDAPDITKEIAREITETVNAKIKLVDDDDKLIGKVMQVKFTQFVVQ